MKMDIDELKVPSHDFRPDDTAEKKFDWFKKTIKDQFLDEGKFRVAFLNSNISIEKERLVFYIKIMDMMMASQSYPAFRETLKAYLVKNPDLGFLPRKYF